MSDMKRVFISGIGYNNLRDMSVGPVLVPELQQLDWPSGVEIDDLNLGGPIAAVHRFREVPPYERVLLFGAFGRGRQTGQIYCYRWDGFLPDRDEIQMRVSEAVTGIISLDNMLIVGGFFGIWPPNIVVVEIEPRDEDWGPMFSPLIQAAIDPFKDAIRWASQVEIERLSTSPDTLWNPEPALGKEHAEAEVEVESSEM